MVVNVWIPQGGGVLARPLTAFRISKGNIEWGKTSIQEGTI